ncbi:hypothetical protein [uncultured Paludibaculum sp.]|uniref:hypothetical protein n=1 Tax=uncultured Paludibaculum sp. TaxID=1765020 RepID=UPI002AABE67D|nr:hypothetical protein [uncultured Paludibaculum sp.]
MIRGIVLMGALLAAAPPAAFSGSDPAGQLPALADPQVRTDGVAWLTLNETTDGIRKELGQPALVADFGADLVSWQFQLGDIDHHDFSHVLVFRRTDRALLSVTRNYEPERDVDALFPAAETASYAVPDTGVARFRMRVRRLPGERLLLAMSLDGAHQPVGQLVLMRASEVGRFYPWLAKELAARP